MVERVSPAPEHKVIPKHFLPSLHVERTTTADYGALPSVEGILVAREAVVPESSADLLAKSRSRATPPVFLPARQTI